MAGIMALSSYLLMPDHMEDEIKPTACSAPIFMAHGVNDPVVPYTAGEASCRRKLPRQGDRLKVEIPA